MKNLSTSRAAKPVGNISEVPPHAWHTLGTDLFYWNRIDFLVVGDYFSKFLIVRKNPNSSTHAVIKELGMIFTEFGRPFILRIDNGVCYSSREFQQFLEFYQIHYTTSSPHYPQSNESAEALVGISKKLMEKSIKDGKPQNYGLLQYRLTPISSTIPSPLEALTGRKLRTSLPQIPSSIGKLWKVPGFARNSSNFSLVLPPATAWNSNQGSLYSSRKCMEMSGRLDSLINQPRSLIPTRSSFQTVPS